MRIKISIVGGDKKAAPLELVCEKISARSYDCFDSGEEAVRRIPKKGTDLALVNFKLPCMDGFECARELKAQRPGLPILMFTSGLPTHRRDDELIFPALHAGASGYLPGHLPPSEFAGAIHQVHNSARCNRPVFLMFFESDRQLGCSARHWEKIAAILNAPTATVSYGKDWRKVVMPFKKVARRPRIHCLVPPVVISDRIHENCL